MNDGGPINDGGPMNDGGNEGGGGSNNNDNGAGGGDNGDKGEGGNEEEEGAGSNEEGEGAGSNKEEGAGGDKEEDEEQDRGHNLKTALWLALRAEIDLMDAGDRASYLRRARWHWSDRELLRQNSMAHNRALMKNIMGDLVQQLFVGGAVRI
jgi:hypothetical protein